MKTLFTEAQRRALREATVKVEAMTSIEDVLRAVYETGINDHIGYAFTNDIAERAGVSVKVLNSWLGKASRKGLVTGYTMRTRITGGRRPSGTPVKMKHWRVTKAGKKLIGIKSVLDD